MKHGAQYDSGDAGDAGDHQQLPILVTAHENIAMRLYFMYAMKIKTM